MWVLHTGNCAVCGKDYDWVGGDDENPPDTCSEECDAAAEAAGACLRCKRREGRWRKLCLSCFRALQTRAKRHGGWAPIVAAGLAGERASGHGNPESMASDRVVDRGDPGATACSVDGCDRAARLRGMCRKHYDSKRRKESRQCQS